MEKIFYNINIFIILFVLFIPVTAMASSNNIGLSSDTYVGGYNLDVNSTTQHYMPFYESLDLNYPLNNSEISFHASGWLRYDAIDQLYSDRTYSDLSYGYLNYQPKAVPIRFRLGRLNSWFGAADDHYDGFEMLLHTKQGIGFGAFIGNEINELSEYETGNITTGGRVSIDRYMFGLGASAFYTKQGMEIRQARWGLDGWLRPTNMLYLFGRYYYDIVDKELYDGLIKASLTPTNRLFLNAQYAYFNPVSLIDKTSIFWVFSTEFYRTIEGDIGYRLIDNLSIDIDATKYMYSSYGNSYSYGGKLTYDRSPYAAGIELHKADANPTDYLTTRLYVLRNFMMGFYANIDMIYTSYLGELNGYNHSITGQVAVGKNILDDLKVTISADYLDGPYVRHGGFGMLSIKYDL